jgi:hypothetical protein
MPCIPQEHFTGTAVTPCFPKFFTENIYLKMCVEHVKPWEDIEFINIISVWSDLHTHIFSDNITHRPCRYSLDIPLSNCIDTYTEFFEPTELFTEATELTNQIMPENTTFYSYEPEEMKLVDKLYLRMPAIVDITAPRRHANHNDKPKIFLSILFKTPFEFETK